MYKIMPAQRSPAPDAAFAISQSTHDVHAAYADNHPKGGAV
jgi:hypothetical protein